MEQVVELLPAAIAVLLVGLAIGIFMYSSLIRNRYYFVKMARYVNEIRGLAYRNITDGGIDFKNKCKMYTDCNKPEYNNRLSSHLILSYLLALLNGVIVGGIVVLLGHSFLIAIIALLVFTVLQIVSGALCLIVNIKQQDSG